MKKAILLLVSAAVFTLPWAVRAADFVTTLHKPFVQFEAPHEEKMVGLEVVTRYEHQEGGSKAAERDLAGKKHDLLVHELGQRGWHEEPLAIDDITAKKMEMVIGYRTTVFVYQCEFPGSEFPYRGEEMREFFQAPIAKMAECLADANNLKE